MRRRNFNRFRQLGAWLREARNERDLRGMDLAELVGVPQPLISDIEAGFRFPDVFDMARIASALEISPQVLHEYLLELAADPTLDPDPLPEMPEQRNPRRRPR